MPISLRRLATSSMTSRVLLLADGEIVFGGVEALGHLHESLDREGIVLRRHAELLFQLVGCAYFSASVSYWW